MMHFNNNVIRFRFNSGSDVIVLLVVDAAQLCLFREINIFEVKDPGIT